jgi:hypothetical protein
MSDQQAHDVAEIEGLLATRQQLAGWLGRLEETGSRAPESVRAKVRTDYQGRLAQVVAQLSTHRDVIGTTLEGLRAQSEEYGQLRGEELDVRAEAELRHAVGEYGDEEWQLVQLESSGKIASFDHELERLAGEIQRLEEVQALITPEPASRPAAPERRPAASTPKLVSDVPAPAPPPQPRPEAPRFVPRGGSYSARESVSPRPAPRTAPTPIPAPPSGRDDELVFLRSMNVEIEPPSARAHQPNGGAVESEPRSPQPQVKTLKCGECGSLNRPTEWYCERCGAELAAV